MCTSASQSPCLLLLQGLFKLLAGAHVARMLLEVHRHLAAALHPRHRLQRAATARALVSMLSWRTAEPATCRCVWGWWFGGVRALHQGQAGAERLNDSRS
jgi:hypothetical protein